MIEYNFQFFNKNQIRLDWRLRAHKFFFLLNSFHGGINQIQSSTNHLIHNLDEMNLMNINILSSCPIPNHIETIFCLFGRFKMQLELRWLYCHIIYTVRIIYYRSAIKFRFQVYTSFRILYITMYMQGVSICFTNLL